MNENDLFDLLRKLNLFSDLTNRDLRAVLPFVQYKIFPKGGILIQEDAQPSELYFIVAGSVEVGKKIPEETTDQKIAALQAGDWIGKMPYITKSTHCASIRAADELKTLIFDISKIESTPSCEAIYFEICKLVTKQQSQRLRSSNSHLITQLHQEWALLNKHTQIGRMLVGLYFGTTFCASIRYLFLTKSHYSPLVIAPGVLGLILITLIYLIYKSGLPLSFYGLSTQNWKKEVKQAIYYTVPVMGFILLAEWIMIITVPSLQNLTLFIDFQKTPVQSVLIGAAVYSLFVPAQELITRGYVQNCFKAFLKGRYAPLIAIILPNLCFEIIHTFKGLWIAFLAFFMGCFWGYLFNKQKTLVGVTVSHLIIGIWSFFILNLDIIFTILP